MLNITFDKGRGSIVGSYLPIDYGDKIQRINAYLTKDFSKISGTNRGRHVTAAYWVVDKDFDINDLNLEPYSSTNSTGARYCSNVSPINSKVKTTGYNGQYYVNTNTITEHVEEEIEFYFDSTSNINNNANRIFFAFISTPGNWSVEMSEYDDFDDRSLSVPTQSGSVYYKQYGLNDSSNLLRDNNGGILFGTCSIIHVDDSEDEEFGTSSIPAKIQCSDLRYRTWSAPDGTISVNDELGWLDGGEQRTSANATTTTITYKNKSETVKNYIVNKNNSFESEFYIPEGSLKDVVFASPHLGYCPTTNSDAESVNDPRWVFKRSRIMFTIPPTRDKSNKIVNKAVYIRYKVITAISDTTYYTGAWKTKLYTKTESIDTNGIKIVICPRDEGVLDNMEFRVIFQRKFSGAGNSSWSTESEYLFNTYQKPLVNIAYPKMVRNASTGSDYKWPKIVTSNMYANFQGENSIVNKYVCDALTVLLATPQNDRSGIPLFVRFYLAEFKFGRDGLINSEGRPDWGTNETTQALYKSSNISKYATEESILKSESTYKTAALTGIYVNDGSPILFSGRLTDNKLSEVGSQYKLWTYKSWDGVCSDTKTDGFAADELVGNAWPITYTDKDGNTSTLTQEVIGDHYGASSIKEYDANDANKPSIIEQNPSKVLLFRAGYIYLLRVRMFHGAAAGAINTKYGNLNSIAYGYGSDESSTSGYYNYDYDKAVYKGEYPEDDVSQYGELHPYAKEHISSTGSKYLVDWYGPDDGTAGVSLLQSDINKLKKTYPGFSQVDYTLIEPVSPYTSKSNLITVHPTSPQIGANQWITFNYRHLSKNIAGIDSYCADTDYEVNGVPQTAPVLGNTNGGVWNTLTRIYAMYQACAEIILSKFKNRTVYSYSSLNGSIRDYECHNPCDHGGEEPYCNPTIIKPEILREVITLRPVPVEDHNKNADGTPIRPYNNEAYSWMYNKGWQAIRNPIVYRYMSANNNQWMPWFANSGDDIIFVNPQTSGNSQIDGQNFAGPFEIDADGNIVDSFTEEETPVDWAGNKIRKYYYNVVDGNEYRTLSGSYLVNAFRCGQFKSINKFIKETFANNDDTATAQLRDSTPEDAVIYITHDATKGGNANSFKPLDEPLGNVYRWQVVMNAMKSGTSEIQIEDKNPDEYYIGTNTLISPTATYPTEPLSMLCYAPNIQRKYFYKDEYDVNNANAGDGLDFSNTDTKRFTINEFAGVTTGGAIYSSGWPSMYTTPSKADTRYTTSGIRTNTKFFCQATAAINTYGHLYDRIPTCQDCENGVVTGNLTNIGNITPKGARIIDSNSKNVYPLVRTTHYLFFKTHIHTAFTLQVETAIKYCTGCSYDDEGNHDGHNFNTVKLYGYYNGNNFQTNEYIFNFGNANGISEVYGEDNHGWGRCLSADDVAARPIKNDGTYPTKSTSGGIEVPVLVRYTPLLQPKVISETYIENNRVKKLAGGNKNITYVNGSGSGAKSYARFIDSSEIGSSKQVELEEYDLNICYPFIDEKNTYYTTSPNGGNGGNVFYKDYHIDVDTDPSKSVDKYTSDTAVATNMDFLGGYGICTGYTVLLVPSDPNLPSTSSTEYKDYFSNTDGHWNFYKQPANYFKGTDVYTDSRIRSQRVKTAGTVVVAYNVQLDEYLEDPTGRNDDEKNAIDYSALDGGFFSDNKEASKMPAWWQNSDTSVKGRALKNIKINFKNLIDGKFYYKNQGLIKYTSSIGKNTLKLTSANTLKIGLVYDLVIIPVYSNLTNGNHNYVNGVGTINGEAFGGGITDAGKDIHLAGSNPTVLFNYLQTSNEIKNTGGGGGGGGGVTPEPPEDDEPTPPDPNKIYDNDACIVFPNVDNVMFNMNNNEVNSNDITKVRVKEGPGFWLNNSFKLIIRLPSFRTLDTRISNDDMYTIDNMSNGQLQSENGDVADDFLFEDIQIHIGKIEELEEYGWPDKEHLNLNKLTSKNDLAKAHIISYKHYWTKGVFSKKLKNYNSDTTNADDDLRELATAGCLTPYTGNKENPEYAHRFIEVNLSNCEIMNAAGNMVPIYSEYPEGFYIQFRWKSAYAAGNEETQWSPWCGGSCDGGKTWWGKNGVNYFVPVRNYSSIHTEFRSLIKESFPGAYSNSGEVGSGTLSELGSISNHKTKPASAMNPTYYFNGDGNHPDSMIVPEINGINNLSYIDSSNKTVNLSVNDDDPYHNDINYLKTHHNTNNILNEIRFSIPENITNLNQQFWEMLYVDYIIRNMCKLYYKPKYNLLDDKLINTNTSEKIGDLYYGAFVPYPLRDSLRDGLSLYTWGWDNTEYRLFNEAEDIKQYKGSNSTEGEKEFTENKSNKETSINEERLIAPNSSISTINNRYKWDINKYYRRVITKQDFDELNSHLQDLVTFIRHPLLTGQNADNILESALGTRDVLPVSPDSLEFDRTRKGIIGNSINSQAGNGSTNNINHTMMSSNYIQNLWQNILSIHEPGLNINHPNPIVEID